MNKVNLRNLMRRRTILALFFIYIIFLNTSNSLTVKVESNIRINLEDVKTSQTGGGGYIMDLEANYSWEEISTSGIQMTLSNLTDRYEPILFDSAGWNFTFYETEYNKVYVSSKGWMKFTNYRFMETWLYGIPSGYANNFDCIALLSANLSPKYGGVIYYEFSQNPNRFIIEYKNIHYTGPGYRGFGDIVSELIGDFEVILFETGVIKFQYKFVNKLNSFEPIIGLDHGDLLNYNRYEMSLPISSQAIEFTFDELKDINFSLDASIGEEFMWITTEVNQGKMNTIFGVDWEDSFGIAENPKRGYKMKINTTSINKNSTYLEINYDKWDWVYRLDKFLDFPNRNETLRYRINPYNYSNELKFTSIFPLILPQPSVFYLLRAKLTDLYNIEVLYDNYSLTYLEYHESKNINGTHYYIHIHSQYDSGVLNSLSVRIGDNNYIFKMEMLSSYLLTNVSLPFDSAKEYSWLVLDVNHNYMESLFGENWEKDFGLPTHITKFFKTKINITSVIENSTHWSLNYNFWDWTYSNSSFSSVSNLSDRLTYRKDPFNYSKEHGLKNNFPLFIPQPSGFYLEFSKLNESYQFSIETGTQQLKIKLSYPGGWTINETAGIFSYKPGIDLYINAYYDPEGILAFLEIYILDMFSNSNPITIFRMVNFYDGPKPDYVGVNINEIFEYGVHYSEENTPFYVNFRPNPWIIKMEIKYVGGEDLVHNRTIVIIDYFQNHSLGYWNETKELPIFDPSPIIFLYKNYSTKPNPLFTDMIMEANINWTYYINNLGFTPLIKGYKIRPPPPPFRMNLEFSFTYTNKGVLDIFSVFYSGDEFFSLRLNDFDYKLRDSDGSVLISGILGILITSILLIGLSALYWQFKKRIRKTSSSPKLVTKEKHNLRREK